MAYFPIAAAWESTVTYWFLYSLVQLGFSRISRVFGYSSFHQSGFGGSKREDLQLFPILKHLFYFVFHMCILHLLVHRQLYSICTRVSQCLPDFRWNKLDGLPGRDSNLCLFWKQADAIRNCNAASKWATLKTKQNKLWHTPNELRHTLNDLRLTLNELRRTLMLRFAVPFFEIRHTVYWAT